MVIYCDEHHGGGCATKYGPDKILKVFRVINCKTTPPSLETRSLVDKYVASSYVWGSCAPGAWIYECSEFTIVAATWSTRGWTYRGGVLSNRRLVFTEGQVYFEFVDDILAWLNNRGAEPDQLVYSLEMTI